MFSFHTILRVWVASELLMRAISGEAEFITRAAEIRALSREEAGRKLPVRICGVVTWRSTSQDPNFVVDDGERGVYVACVPLIVPVVFENGDHPETTTEPGALVEIEGISNPGGWAPMIMASLVRRVGTGPLLPLRHMPLDRLLAAMTYFVASMSGGIVRSLGTANVPEPLEASVKELMEPKLRSSRHRLPRRAGGQSHRIRRRVEMEQRLVSMGLNAQLLAS